MCRYGLPFPSSTDIPPRLAHAPQHQHACGRLVAGFSVCWSSFFHTHLSPRNACFSFILLRTTHDQAYSWGSLFSTLASSPTLHPATTIMPPGHIPLLCVASTVAMMLLLQTSHAFLALPVLSHVSSTRNMPNHKRQHCASSSSFSHDAKTIHLPAPPAEWTGGLPQNKHVLFLREFWQQKPLLIRQAFDPAVAVVGPNELLSLACDDMVTSRLIEHRPHSGRDKQAGQEEDEKDSEWSVRQGPFDEEDFEDDPEGGRGRGRCWYRRWIGMCLKWRTCCNPSGFSQTGGWMTCTFTRIK